MTDQRQVLLALIIAALVFIAIVTLAGCALFSTQSTADVLTSGPTQQMWKTVAKTNWFGTFCLLSFFGGVVAVGLDQRKIGGAIIIASITTICLGLAIHRFPVWLAIIGFTGSVIATGYSILIKNKALVEIIRGVQKYRDGVGPHIATALDTELGVQSSSTKKIVDKVQKKLNGKEKI